MIREEGYQKRNLNLKVCLLIEDEDYSKSRTKIGLSVDKTVQKVVKVCYKVTIFCTVLSTDKPIFVLDLE